MRAQASPPRVPRRRLRLDEQRRQAGYARKSLHMMVDGLREDDTVGLCTYAGRVARVLEPTSAGSKRRSTMPSRDSRAVARRQ